MRAPSAAFSALRVRSSAWYSSAVCSRSRSELFARFWASRSACVWAAAGAGSSVSPATTPATSTPRIEGIRSQPLDQRVDPAAAVLGAGLREPRLPGGRGPRDEHVEVELADQREALQVRVAVAR